MIKVPNSKFQIPKKSQTSGAPASRTADLKFGIWNFFGTWNLELGVC
jgi:hypothetical protein